MKTIGLIGGMSWESTIPYYRIINETVASRLGGYHSARLVLYSVDFDPVERWQRDEQWPQAGAALAEAAAALERAGASVVVLATNTMHRVAEAIEARVAIPLLHIVDPTARAVQAAGCTRVGLLGTRYTMEQPFYRGRLEREFGLEVVVPEAAARQRVHEIIYEELCRGVIEPRSRAAYAEVVDELAVRGAEAVILGCTEIGLLLRAEDARLPLFDTTRLHAEAAAAFALG